MNGDKDPADNLADQIRTHEAKITETSAALDKWIERVRQLENEVRALRRERPAPRHPDTGRVDL